MRSLIKVILISHLPLPYHKIGSWTTMYDNYIQNKNSQIDLIICPKPEVTEYQNTQYLYCKKSVFYKIKSKLIKNRFYPILNKLSKYIKQNPDNKFIIQSIDNQGALNSLIDFRTKNNLHDNIYLQYFFHGFILNNENKIINKILQKTDELIVLTKSSLRKHRNVFEQLPQQTCVLQNGIDTSLFKSSNKKENKDKTIFLWCSQDRPKKGLHIILEIWSKFHFKHKNTELWIVGTHNKIIGQGIKSFERVKNNKLPEIYNNADVYLFPTLCLEGFGLTLAEALHCGCFCIASNIGGVPEVLNHGEYGWLIEEPHNSNNWLKAMLKYIAEKPETPKIPKSLYSLQSWTLNLNNIISDAKRRLD